MQSRSARIIRLGELLARGDSLHYSEPTLRGGQRVTMHTHDFVEIFWVTAGSGLEISPSGAVSLSAGDLVFVAARDVHGFEAAEGSSLSLRNLAFFRRSWVALRARYGDALADPFNTGAGARRYRAPQLLGLLEEASQELRAGGRSRLCLDRFLLRLDEVLSRDRTRASRAPDWLTDAVAALADDSGAELARGTQLLFDRCGRSPEHVARCSREFSNLTPTQIIDEARLLGETDLPVLQVCYDSGFNNVGHFHSRFRHRFGETPRTHRARLRGAVQVETPDRPGPRPAG